MSLARSNASVPGMEFVMSAREKLEAAVSRLRGAGYEDASRGQQRAGDPSDVLNVSAGSAEDERLVRDLVRDVDPESRPL